MSQAAFEVGMIVVGMVFVIIGATIVFGVGGFLISVGSVLIATPVFGRAGF